MSKFRKKPITISAVQFEGGMPSIAQITNELQMKDSDYNFQNGSNGKFHIHTLEGTMTANVGDWIIRGIKGEFYPCADEIFAATYEPVD